jgi:hypothetical protein
LPRRESWYVRDVATKTPDPVWRIALQVVITVALVIIALPAVLEGDWFVALSALALAVITEFAVVMLVQRSRRRRNQQPRDTL